MVCTLKSKFLSPVTVDEYASLEGILFPVTGTGIITDGNVSFSLKSFAYPFYFFSGALNISLSDLSGNGSVWFSGGYPSEALWVATTTVTNRTCK